MTRAFPRCPKPHFLCVLGLCLGLLWGKSDAQGLVGTQDLDRQFSIYQNQSTPIERADLQTSLKEAVFRLGAPVGHQYSLTLNGQSLVQGQKKQEFDFNLGAHLYFRVPFRGDYESYLSRIGFTVPRATTVEDRSLFVFLAGSGNIIGRNLQGSAKSPYWLASLDNLGTPTVTSQVGIGWRDGPLSLYLGYMDKNYKNAHTLKGMSMGHDGIAGLTFSFRPK